jgi:hypothetical protein
VYCVEGGHLTTSRLPTIERPYVAEHVGRRPEIVEKTL